MKPLFDITDLTKIKRKETYTFECEECGKLFTALGMWIIFHLAHNSKRKNPSKNPYSFCTKECAGKYNRTSEIKNCGECNKPVIKKQKEIKSSKSGKVFCNQSCSATYNNKHKTIGTRRSKLEKWLEEQLTIFYPELEILYNKKLVIDSELDIYIPKLKLAIELNGPVHYKPIYGEEKFKQIKNNDVIKQHNCLKQHISLIIIDVSNYKTFSIKTALIYFKCIRNLISAKHQILHSVN